MASLDQLFTLSDSCPSLMPPLLQITSGNIKRGSGWSLARASPKDVPSDFLPGHFAGCCCSQLRLMGCGLSWLGQNPGSPLCCLSTGTTAPATAGAKLTVDSSRHPPVPRMLLPLRIQPHSIQHRPPGGLPVSTSHQPNNAF